MGKVNNGIKWQGIPETYNGDNVIGMASSSQIAEILADTDRSSLESWYKRNPEENYLGILQTVGAAQNVSYPLLNELMSSRVGQIRLNGYTETMPYDMQTSVNTGTFTKGDTSSRYRKPGIGETTFEIILNRKFRPGDILTCGAQSMKKQIIVSSEHMVQQIGDAWLHFVKLHGGGKKDWYPSDKLKPGIQYFKIDHRAGEFSTQLSGFDGISGVRNIRCEFTLGNHRGVEASSTMYGGDMLLQNLTMSTKTFLNKVKNQIEAWGPTATGEDADTVAIGRLTQNQQTGKWNVDTGNMKVMSVLEYLGFAELFRMTGTSLMFTRGALISDANSVLRSNEGLWWQAQRGYTIGYTRPGGLNWNHIRQATDYIFRNSKSIPLEKRWVKFRAGKMAHERAMSLVQNEFNIQIQMLAPLFGTDRMLPKNPISGTLDNLKLDMVRVGQTFVPGIGNVIFEHDPSLDMMPMDDIQEQGFYGNDMPWTSYSLYIEDITSTSSSNAYQAKPIQASNMKILRPGTNLYHITPKQGSLNWGYEHGRWDHMRNGNIMSSNPKFAETFFCYNFSSAWYADLSKIVMIQLERW